MEERDDKGSCVDEEGDGKLSISELLAQDVVELPDGSQTS